MAKGEKALRIKQLNGKIAKKTCPSVANPSTMSNT
jgi:hypothetical protein